MAKEWIVPDADLGCDGAYFDYQELVRCRECVHWATGTNGEESWEYCTLLDHEIDGDMFCSYGERKDGAGR